MTLPELLADEELRQREFPVAREKIFLAHAGVCPLPRRVVDAMTDYTLLAALGDQEEAFPVPASKGSASSPRNYSTRRWTKSPSSAPPRSR